MLRNTFVREEHDSLVLASGIPRDWLESGCSLWFGPTATPFGEIVVELNTDGRMCDVNWSAQWRGLPKRLSVELPACPPVIVDPEAGQFEISIADAIRA
jgi:hypothetical protein